MLTDQNGISIIIPVYNEVDNVELLSQEVIKSLTTEEIPFEVIFVDDGSTDGTREKLYSLTLSTPSIKLVCHKSNYGQSAALVSGAKSAWYPILITMDGDGQNDPQDIPALLKHYKSSYTVILGNRKKRDDNFLRQFSSRVGNGIRNWVLQDKCPDTGCSLKVFSKEGFLAIPHFNHMHRFLPALFKRNGYELINVPVNHRARNHGVSKYGVMNRLFVGIYDLVGMRWLLKRPCAPEVYQHEE
jgi:dolichol-phosphate mannosyltransferase